MFIDKRGEGDRAYFGLHGWAGNHRTFRRLEKFMPGDAVFYTPDLPGYGGTPRPREWTVGALLEPIAEAFRSLDIDDVTLVGNCGGALTALELAMRVPGKVARAVLIDPFAFNPWYFDIFLKGEFGRRAYMTTFANPIGRFCTNQALFNRRSSTQNLTSAFEDVDHEAAIENLRLLKAMAPDERYLDKLDIAIDIAYGEKTFPAVRKGLSVWRRVFPHARVTELKGAGHEPIKEAPEALAAICFGVSPRASQNGTPKPAAAEVVH